MHAGQMLCTGTQQALVQPKNCIPNCASSQPQLARSCSTEAKPSTAHTKRWATFQLPTPVVTTPTISLSAIAMPKSSKPLQLNNSLFCNSASRVATSTRLECCCYILVLEGSESLLEEQAVR